MEGLILVEIKEKDGIPCIILPDGIIDSSDSFKKAKKQSFKDLDFTAIQRQKERCYYKLLMKDLIDNFKNK